jgi:hypothetical protein
MGQDVIVPVLYTRGEREEETDQTRALGEIARKINHETLKQSTNVFRSLYRTKRSKGGRGKILACSSVGIRTDTKEEKTNLQDVVADLCLACVCLPP